MVTPMFGLFLAGAVAVALATMFHHYAVRVTAARAWLERGAFLVDVDRAEDFARRRPQAGVNIPLEDLCRRAHELGGKEQPVVIFSQSWFRGFRAANDLRGVGFWEVLNAAGLALSTDNLKKHPKTTSAI